MIMMQISGEQAEKEIGISLPMGRLDGNYYYTTDAEMDLLLPRFTYREKWLAEKRDCDNFAIKAMSDAQWNYGLTTFGMAVGWVNSTPASLLESIWMRIQKFVRDWITHSTPKGKSYHAFNIFRTDSGWWLHDPNGAWGSVKFRIGEHGYQPEKALI